MESPSWIANIDWTKHDGLVPAIVQHALTGEVLMLGFMNAEALETTLTREKVTFYSRSKARLWTKGESSGHVLSLVDLALDCDRDALLVLAHPHGPTCHLLTRSCFGAHAQLGSVLQRLAARINQRAEVDGGGGYTQSLLTAGIERCAQKVGEEGVEVALAAVSSDTDQLNEEAADLLYHLLVTLKAAGSDIESVLSVLDRRYQAS